MAKVSKRGRPGLNRSRAVSKERQDQFVMLYEQGLSTQQIAERLGFTRSGISRALKKAGVQMREPADYTRRMSTMKSGYLAVHAPDHPRAFGCGKQYEHILIAERLKGRLLEDNEVVHHVDLNKLNNNEENLEVLTQKEHVEKHRQLSRLTSKLISSGFIYYDRHDGQYKSHLLKGY